MTAGNEDGAGPGARGTIGADRLARLIGVPLSVLTFLEARISEVRSLVEGSGRAYRAQDAVLLAGLAELLYDEGLSLRDVQGMMDRGEREAIAERGRQRLGDALPAPVAGAPGRARPIPEDALVVTKGTGLSAPRRAPAREGEAEAVLAELIACVRILEAAR